MSGKNNLTTSITFRQSVTYKVALCFFGKIIMRTRILLSLCWLCLFASLISAQPKTENVILITLDGARTEEVFGGLDLDVLKSKTKRGKVEDTALYKQFYAATSEERRMKLMPFFWGTLMKEHGSIAGNRALGSSAMTTNKMWFSYPGYSEILTGQAHDDVINSNDRKRNQFPSVLEFLKAKLKLNDKQVAGFASWDVMNWIAESKEGSITLNAGYEVYDSPDPAIRVMNKTQSAAATPWDSVRHDHYTFEFAMAHSQICRQLRGFPRLSDVSIAKSARKRSVG